MEIILFLVKILLLCVPLLFVGALLYLIFVTVSFLWLYKSTRGNKRVEYLTLLGEHYSFRPVFLFAIVSAVLIVFINQIGDYVKISEISQQVKKRNCRVFTPRSSKCLRSSKSA